jgi:hypothetical protein
VFNALNLNCSCAHVCITVCTRHRCSGQRTHYSPVLCLLILKCSYYRMNGSISWNVLGIGATSEATSETASDRNTRVKLQSQAVATSRSDTLLPQLPVEAVCIIAAMVGFPWLLPGWHPELRCNDSTSNSSKSNSSSINSSIKGHSNAGTYVVQSAPMHAAVCTHHIYCS